MRQGSKSGVCVYILFFLNVFGRTSRCLDYSSSSSSPPTLEFNSELPLKTTVMYTLISVDMLVVKTVIHGAYLLCAFPHLIPRLLNLGCVTRANFFLFPIGQLHPNYFWHHLRCRLYIV